MPGDFIAGPHTITAKIGSGAHTSIGGTEDGITILEEPRKQDVNDDEYGDVPVDSIDRGVITRIRFTHIRYADVQALMYAGRAQGKPKQGVGRLLSKARMEIVATPVPGTTAAAHHGPVTFYLCAIDGNFDVLMGSGHTKGPLTLMTYPDPAHDGDTYDMADPEEA